MNGRHWIRSLVLWSCWVVAVSCGLSATTGAYVTFATNDYRPVLVRGVWAATIGLIALHGAALAAKGWKGRSSSAAAALLNLVVLAELLRRLKA